MIDSLFQFQTDLIDNKVNMATMNAMDSVVAQIRDLRTEMRNEFHEIRFEMNNRFSSIENRLVAVETKLGMVNEREKELRQRFFDYAFRAGWIFFGALGCYLAVHFH